MGIEVKRCLLNAAEQIAKRHVARKPGPQHMGVKQEADHRLQFLEYRGRPGECPKKCHRSRIAVEQRIQCSSKDCEQAGLFLPAGLAQRFCQSLC